MKILIIGVEGFIGKSCRSYFSERGHAVCGADIIEKKEQGYFFINPLQADYNCLFNEALPDVCINASGSADVGFSLKNPGKDYELNVMNVERMLDAIKKIRPGCKFLNFSSAAVYGNPRVLPVNESAETNPLSPYGNHKLKSESLLREYHTKHGLMTCSLRVFSAYGIGLKKQLFWDIYRKTFNGKKINLFGTGEESRDFIFSEDLVNAIDTIIQQGTFTGEAINVSSGVETKIKDAAGTFLSFLGKEFCPEFSGEEKAGDPKNWRADISLLKQMGFTPFVTFDVGINRYAEWLKGLKSE
jgi:UDP-glucose 4-epimerase